MHMEKGPRLVLLLSSLSLAPVTVKAIEKWEQSDNRNGRVFALHAANTASIPNILYGSLSTPRSHFSVKIQE